MAGFMTPTKGNANEAKNEKIIIPPSPFLNRLGYGTGVNVMQLVRSPLKGENRSPWALKMLNKRMKPSKVYTERLVSEANILRRMSHPNIVGFRAFGHRKILYLGMEACDISLGDMIEKRLEDDSGIFAPKQILKVAADIAKALDYIHTKIRVLHGDIKSYNILVNGDFVICKLCDFGVTVPLEENGFVDREKHVYFGTEAWSAPEVLQDGQICDKTDIWPMGLTLWEMMALVPPHTFPNDETTENSIDTIDDMEKTLDEYFLRKFGARPVVPVNVSEKVYVHPLALFYCCTELEAEMRPSANTLAIAASDMLEQCLKEN